MFTIKPKRLRLPALAIGVALFATACLSATGGSDATGDPLAASTGREDVPSALDNPTDSSFPDPLVPVAEIRSGGPPPDGIPPIDEPKLVPVSEVDFLEDGEPVLALELEGKARAYPVQIMIWHEIANDEIGGVPITVSYCPLCNSAVAYDRRVDERVLDFGTSGSLYRSSLVMYDRQTESLWTHFDGQAVVGALTGTQLEIIPLSTVSWKDFKDANPDALVLSQDTGATRDYGRNPYPGYDTADGEPFLFDGDVDPRLRAMTRVVGVQDGDAALTVTLDRLEQDGVVAADLGAREVAVFHKDGAASGLERQSVAGGRDVGSNGVFETTVDGRSLTFTANGDGTFSDAETGSTWDIFGTATAGELAGTELSQLDHLDTFWFAWGTWQPDAELIE